MSAAMEVITCKCGATSEQDSTPRLFQRSGRFPFFVACERCGRQTTTTGTGGAAVALWNAGRLLLGPYREGL